MTNKELAICKKQGWNVTTIKMSGVKNFTILQNKIFGHDFCLEIVEDDVINFTRKIEETNRDFDPFKYAKTTNKGLAYAYLLGNVIECLATCL